LLIDYKQTKWKEGAGIESVWRMSNVLKMTPIACLWLFHTNCKGIENLTRKAAAGII
jgi:hypothetical protein